MKVAFITPWERHCGIADYSHALLAELGSRCRVSVLAWDSEGRLRTLLAPIARFGRIVRAMRGADVAHVEYEIGSYLFLGLPAFRIAAWIARTPLAITYHERPGSRKTPLPIRLYERAICAAGDLTIVHSREHLEELPRRRRTALIPHGVRARRAPYRGDDITVLAAGFWVRWKRYDRLIRAFATTLDEQKDARLRIIGKPHHRAYYERCLRLIDELGIGEHVEIRADFVPDEEFEAAFTSAAILAIPYEEITASGILAHGLGHGVPIASHALPTVAEYAGTGALLMDMDDAAASGRAIAGLLADRDERERMHAALEHRAEELSWAHVADQTIEAYREIAR